MRNKLLGIGFAFVLLLSGSFMRIDSRKHQKEATIMREGSLYNLENYMKKFPEEKLMLNNYKKSIEESVIKVSNHKKDTDFDFYLNQTTNKKDIVETPIEDIAETAKIRD